MARQLAGVSLVQLMYRVLRIAPHHVPRPPYDDRRLSATEPIVELLQHTDIGS